jgi:hypothetical protein
MPDECCGGCGPTYKVREFDTGATRDTDHDKMDYEGFLSPLVLAEFARYMHKHRVQADGTLRDSDNWQKGIPLDAYMKSMFRHFMELWAGHRDDHKSNAELLEALMALMFNVQGYAHELLIGRDASSGRWDGSFE